MTDQPTASPTPDAYTLYHETAAEQRDRLVKDRDSWKILAESTNARCDRLLIALETYSSLSLLAFKLVDADKETKAMKLLKAMAGGLPGYRDDIDEARAVLAKAHTP